MIDAEIRDAERDWRRYGTTDAALQLLRSRQRTDERWWRAIQLLESLRACNPDVAGVVVAAGREPTLRATLAATWIGVEWWESWIVEAHRRSPDAYRLIGPGTIGFTGPRCAAVTFERYVTGGMRLSDHAALLRAASCTRLPALADGEPFRPGHDLTHVGLEREVEFMVSAIHMPIRFGPGRQAVQARVLRDTTPWIVAGGMLEPA